MFQSGQQLYSKARLSGQRLENYPARTPGWKPKNNDGIATKEQQPPLQKPVKKMEGKTKKKENKKEKKAMNGRGKKTHEKWRKKKNVTPEQVSKQGMVDANRHAR